MSWPSVRTAVLESLTQLVDNPHAQPVLKRALPQLATLLADPVVKVRLGFCGLGGLAGVGSLDMMLALFLEGLCHAAPLSVCLHQPA